VIEIDLYKRLQDLSYSKGIHGLYVIPVLFFLVISNPHIVGVGLIVFGA
jgi:hypothetical protein